MTYIITNKNGGTFKCTAGSLRSAVMQAVASTKFDTSTTLNVRIQTGD